MAFDFIRRWRARSAASDQSAADSRQRRIGQGDRVIDRRTVLGGIVAATVSRPLPVFAQSDAPAQVGWVAVAPIQSNLEVFREAMRQRGYVQGRNLRIEERYATTVDRYAIAIADLVRLKVDVIVTMGGVASHEARRLTSTTPVVFFTTDPVGSGLVASLARPAGNLTGVAIITQEFNAKRVETIVSMIPNLRTLAALSDESGTLSANLQTAFWEEVETASRRFGLRLAPRAGIRNIDQVDDAFAAAARAGAGGMVTISSSYFNAYKGRVVGAAARVRLPTIYEHRDFVEAGGLVSYGPDLREAGRLAASYVDRILKGAKPADIPVEQVSKVELVMNQKTAKTLGLVIPQSLLLRADDVIP
jgi:putative ABC transport system substrate-binding protein